MIRAEHDSILTTGLNGGLQADLVVNNGIEIDIRPQNLPNGLTVRAQLPGSFQVRIMLDAALDSAGEERQRSARVREDDLQRGDSVEDAGENEPSDGYRRLEREAEGERQDVAVLAGPWAPDFARQAVVRMQEYGKLRVGQGGEDGQQSRVVETASQSRGAEDDASTVG